MSGIILLGKKARERVCGKRGRGIRQHERRETFHCGVTPHGHFLKYILFPALFSAKNRYKYDILSGKQFR